MKERPILFSAPMVRALLDGSKTQTRRIVKPQWADVDAVSQMPCLDRYLKCVVSGDSGIWEDEHGLNERRKCPYGVPGDRIWVRETWKLARYGYYGPPPASPEDSASAMVQYRADDAKQLVPAGDVKMAKMTGAWRPSIFMPRWASRLTLEVTAVRVERLQEISEEDAKAEGVRADSWDYPVSTRPATSAYRTLWDSLNAKRGYGWAVNPWVWKISFRRVQP